MSLLVVARFVAILSHFSLLASDFYSTIQSTTICFPEASCQF
jgi:hypothetical protein